MMKKLLSCFFYSLNFLAHSQEHHGAVIIKHPIAGFESLLFQSDRVKLDSFEILVAEYELLEN